jgi:hypothetical protein
MALKLIVSVHGKIFRSCNLGKCSVIAWYYHSIQFTDQNRSYLIKKRSVIEITTQTVSTPQQKKQQQWLN